MSNQPQSFAEYEQQSCEFVEGFRNDNPKAMVQYVRRSNRTKRQIKESGANSSKARQPIGVIVAFIGMGGEIRIGWSLFNLKHETNRFNPAAGLRKAVERAREPKDYAFDVEYKALDGTTHNGVPQTIRKPLATLLERANRHYSKESD